MTCPVCGRRVRLTRDGRFAKHASHGATTCPNSGAEAPLSGSPQDDRCPHGFPSGGWDCCRHDPSLDDHMEDT